MLGVPVTRVHQHLRDGHLLALRRDGIVVVPQVFFTDTGHVVKSLPGLLAVLRDGGYRDTEILRWLFTPDESLTVTARQHARAAHECSTGRCPALSSGSRSGAAGSGSGVLTSAAGVLISTRHAISAHAVAMPT